MGVLTVITFLPVAGALLLLFIPKEKLQLIRLGAAVSSGAAFLASLWLAANFNMGSSDFQFVEKIAWIPTFNIQYFLGVDGLSLVLVVLTTLLTLLSIIASFGIENRIKEYFFFFLLLDVSPHRREISMCI